MDSETLKSIYQRVSQYCHTKYGAEPDEIHILEDGSFNVVYGGSNRGEYYEESYSVGADALTADLDEVYAERKRQEAETAAKQKAERERRETIQKQREKEERRQLFLKLKNEFGDK